MVIPISVEKFPVSVFLFLFVYFVPVDGFPRSSQKSWHYLSDSPVSVGAFEEVAHGAASCS